MAGQDQEALDQAGHEDRHHHQRNGAQDLADDARDDRHRHKGGDGGERGGGHRCQHAPGTALRRRQAAGTAQAARHRVLADDNGVVDDDADHHDQREQADHVDRLAGGQHHRQRRHHRHRDAHRHPQRDAAVEEQEKRADDQHQAAEAVAQQKVDALLDEAGAEVELLHAQARRQARAQLGEGIGDDRRQLERVVADRALDMQLDRRLAVEKRNRRRLFRRIADAGDITEPHLLTAAQRPHLDVAQGLGIAAAAEAANLQLGGTGGIARGQVLAAGVDRPRDVLERQVELEQGGLADLHPHFRIAGTEQGDLVDAVGEKLVA